MYAVNTVFEENFAREWQCFPLRYEGEALLIAATDKSEAQDEIKSKLAALGIGQYRLLIYEAHEIRRLINQYYSIELKDPEIFNTIRDLIRRESFEALFQYIVTHARAFCASDIHIANVAEHCIIRFRIKGKLKTFCVIERRLGEVLGRVIKVRANLDVSKALRPADASIRLLFDDEALDIRLSIIPTNEGEKFSLRLLHDRNVPQRLEELGLLPEELQKIRQAILRESGAVIVTGPTGSGKSTTVRCFLAEINDGQSHIISIEDPIEYKMEGITQIQVEPRATDSFNDSVRAILRQDPDILFIGEIRDEVSAEVAMKASLTGHLVFTTLHTKSPRLTIERLENLGIDRRMIFNSVSMIINQRLVNELCTKCRHRVRYQGEPIEELALHRGDPITEAAGCPHCGYSGVERRIPIMSILEFDHRTTVFDLSDEIGDDGIRQRIISKFKEGKLSLSEVRRFL